MNRPLAIEPSSIPDKLFYKIGEVSKLAGVEPYVLRYWETEFSFLKPRKSKSGQRIYVKKDLDLIFEIKSLLYKERFTIEGVRKKFTDHSFRPERVMERIVEMPPQQKLAPAAPVIAPQPAPKAHAKAKKPAASSSLQQSLLPEAPTADAVAHIKLRLRDILSKLD